MEVVLAMTEKTAAQPQSPLDTLGAEVEESLHPALQWIVSHIKLIVGVVAVLLLLVGSLAAYRAVSASRLAQSRAEMAALLAEADPAKRAEALAAFAAAAPESLRTAASLELAASLSAAGRHEEAAAVWARVNATDLGSVPGFGQAAELSRAGKHARGSGRASGHAPEPAQGLPDAAARTPGLRGRTGRRRGRGHRRLGGQCSPKTRAAAPPSSAPRSRPCGPRSPRPSPPQPRQRLERHIMAHPLLDTKAAKHTCFWARSHRARRPGGRCGLRFLLSRHTPSSEVPDTFFRIAPDGDFHFEYSTNEKVALEVAGGASLAGAPPW
jgi:hypothetical protein